MKFVASLLVTGVSAQYGYPAFYGMKLPGFNYGNQFNSGSYFGMYNNAGSFGGYGKQCRKGVRSEDLNGYQRCFCDQHHRDEDFCGGDKLTTACANSIDEAEFPDNIYYFDHSTFIQDGIIKDALDDYYDDVYDEDCVERYDAPPAARKCPKGVYTKDLSGVACRCDQNHKKSIDMLDDLDDCVLYENLYLDDDFWVAMHYEVNYDDVEVLCGEYICERRRLLGGASRPEDQILDECIVLNEDAGEDFEKFDPNCIEQTYYGGWGGSGALNWGRNQGFQAFQSYPGFQGFGISNQFNQFYSPFSQQFGR